MAEAPEQERRSHLGFPGSQPLKECPNFQMLQTRVMMEKVEKEKGKEKGTDEIPITPQCQGMMHDK